MLFWHQVIIQYALNNSRDFWNMGLDFINGSPINAYLIPVYMGPLLPWVATPPPHPHPHPQNMAEWPPRIQNQDFIPVLAPLQKYSVDRPLTVNPTAVTVYWQTPIKVMPSWQTPIKVMPTDKLPSKWCPADKLPSKWCPADTNKCDAK